MKIIGLNACLGVTPEGDIKKVDGGGVCLYENGEITIGISEERLTKKKYDGGFLRGLEYILSERKLSLNEIDHFIVSFYGLPYNIPKKVKDFFIEKLGKEFEDKVTIMPSHHLSHAYAAYYQSGFPEDGTIVIVNDNEGQIIEGSPLKPLYLSGCERNSYYLVENGELRLIHRDFDKPNDIGFGRMYNKFTRYIGFESYHNAGKTMGLAPFGRLEWFKDKDLFYHDSTGRLRAIIRDTGNFVEDVDKMLQMIGTGHIVEKRPAENMTQQYADLAAFIQEQLEKWQVITINRLHKEYSFNRICVSGGVALNCPTNTNLAALDYIKDVFIPSAPQDQGQCIGNVIYGAKMFDSPDIKFKEKLYLGKLYDVTRETIMDITRDFPNLRVHYMKNKIATVATLLSQGKIIAWFQGRSEFGPRALGNRSILADPRDNFIKDTINVKIKKRETFRPFAPSVILEETNKFFDFPNSSSPSMMFTAKIKDSYKGVFPAIEHIDGSSRLQTVSKESNPLFYKLLQYFGLLTGSSMLLNTSFNLNGMPIVETPQDAIKCFSGSGIDALALGDFLITEKSEFNE